MIPRVAIVGRPNVGKSTLLNRLAGRRVSITHPMAGVTRDRITTEITINDRQLEIMDTGGIGIVDRQDLHPEIHQQIDVAIAEAEMILFVVDARSGIQPNDREIADRLRQHNGPLLLVANKCETGEAQATVGEFYTLGLGDPFPISAEHGDGIRALEDKVEQALPVEGREEFDDPTLKIAIVGRRNAGKSTFVNALLKEERVIASPIAGTTRDAVDIRFTKDDREFVIIDTAGIQRKAKISDNMEYYAQVRSLEAIRRADMVIFLMDAVEGIDQIDKRIAREIADQHKVCVIGLNKWDLVKGQTTPLEYSEYLLKTLPGLYYAPLIALTAIDGRKVSEAISLAQSLTKQASETVSTGQLNRAVEVIRDAIAPRSKGGRYPKIYYCTQIGVMPPTLVMFVNNPKFFSANYRRQIANRLRKLLPFPETPIRVVFRARKEADQPDPRAGGQKQYKGKKSSLM